MNINILSWEKRAKLSSQAVTSMISTNVLDISFPYFANLHIIVWMETQTHQYVWIWQAP